MPAISSLLEVLDKGIGGSRERRAKGDREECSEKLKALNPLLLDILPLTLEEIFIYEMELLGYAYEKLSV